MPNNTPLDTIHTSANINGNPKGAKSMSLFVDDKGALEKVVQTVGSDGKSSTYPLTVTTWTVVPVTGEILKTIEEVTQERHIHHSRFGNGSSEYFTDSSRLISSSHVGIAGFSDINEVIKKELEYNDISKREQKFLDNLKTATDLQKGLQNSQGYNENPTELLNRVNQMASEAGLEGIASAQNNNYSAEKLFEINLPSRGA